MDVLVAYASRHGATKEIAESLGRGIAASGAAVEVSPAESVQSLAAYDAVVIGSALYVGQWLEPARAFVQRFAADLRSRPCWLFSSGPVDGKPPLERADPTIGATILDLGARDYRLFGGKLDRRRLAFHERWVASALRVADGDYRDWGEIERYAAAIASAIVEQQEAVV